MNERQMISLTAAGAWYEAQGAHEQVSLAALLAVSGPQDRLAVKTAMLADDAARWQELLARIARCDDDHKAADAHLACAYRLRVQAAGHIRQANR